MLVLCLRIFIAKILSISKSLSFNISCLKLFLKLRQISLDSTFLCIKHILINKISPYKIIFFTPEKNNNKFSLLAPKFRVAHLEAMSCVNLCALKSVYVITHRRSVEILRTQFGNVNIGRRLKTQLAVPCPLPKRQDCIPI